MIIFNEIRRLPEFDKDLKRLLKKYLTLEEDLEVFISTQLQMFHKLKLDNGSIVQIPALGIACPQIFKVRKFSSRSFKGKGAVSGIRVIYAYYEQEDAIELVEIYFKGEKENEDRNRILKYYKKCGINLGTK